MIFDKRKFNRKFSEYNENFSRMRTSFEEREVK